MFQFKFRKISQVLYNSLVDDPFYRTLESSILHDKDDRHEAMLSYYDYSLQEAQKYGELVIPRGKMYGASVWTKPKDPVLTKQLFSEKKTFIKKYLGFGSLQLYQTIIDFMSDKSRRLAPENSWYLSIVGVSPEFQGQGLGSTLIQPVLAITDPIGIPTYLESYTLRNKSFYKRLGYHDVASFIEPVTNSEYWIMIREPVVVS